MRVVKWLCCSTALLAYCCTQASAADGPPVYSVPAPDVTACSYLTSDGCETCTSEPSCDTCSSCCTCGPCISLFPCCDHGDPWTLQGHLTGDCCGSSSITYGGWLSVGAYGNAHGAASNGPISFRNVGDGFTVNQLWGYVEKGVDTGGCGFDWGFRADYVFGVDGPDTQAFGSSDPQAWDNGWDSSDEYGSALPQLYAQLGINDLTVTMGHFYTIIGYEVVQAPDNFFTSYAYTMYYAEPFTHTGVLAEYALGDDITVWGGWVQSWDTAFDNPNGGNNFLGGISVPLLESLSLTYAVVTGTESATATDTYMHSIVADATLTEKLEYVLQSDYGASTGGTVGQWYGVNNYLFYTINDCWKLGTRIEWFHDDDGIRGPAQGDMWGATWGVNWQPTANLKIRPELRYDWYDGPGALPFDNGNASDQFSGGFDLIVTF